MNTTKVCIYAREREKRKRNWTSFNEQKRLEQSATGTYAYPREGILPQIQDKKIRYCETQALRHEIRLVRASTTVPMRIT